MNCTFAGISPYRTLKFQILKASFMPQAYQNLIYCVQILANGRFLY